MTEYNRRFTDRRYRPRSYVLALIALALLMAWLDGGNLGAQIVEERRSNLKAEHERCERNTRVAVAALNGWRISEGEVTVACQRVKEKS